MEKRERKEEGYKYHAEEIRFTAKSRLTAFLLVCKIKKEEETVTVFPKDKPFTKENLEAPESSQFCVNFLKTKKCSMLPTPNGSQEILSIKAQLETGRSSSLQRHFRNFGVI